jgi:hypothetical protein
MLASNAAAHLATSTQAPGQCLADLQLVGAGVGLQCLQDSQTQGRSAHHSAAAAQRIWVGVTAADRAENDLGWPAAADMDRSYWNVCTCLVQLCTAVVDCTVA